VIPLSDQDKLRLLLPHWVEHNQEHAEEFRRWAERVGLAQVDMLTAAENLESVNHILAQALEKLGGPLEHHEGREHHHPHD
jgi:hypothetical protein